MAKVASLSGETVATGVVTCLIIYPLYLLVFTLFRMSRSKVTQTCTELFTQRILHTKKPKHDTDGLLFVRLHQCVSVEQVPPQVDQESVEIDDFLDNSMAGSSFLFFNGEVECDGETQTLILADRSFNMFWYIYSIYLFETRPPRVFQPSGFKRLKCVAHRNRTDGMHVPCEIISV